MNAPLDRGFCFMNSINYFKKSDFKIFGKVIFTMEESYVEKDYKENELKVYITQDYFNDEFDIEKKKKE